MKPPTKPRCGSVDCEIARLELRLQVTDGTMHKLMVLIEERECIRRALIELRVIRNRRNGVG
jgi:hypothetical protein